MRLLDVLERRFWQEMPAFHWENEAPYVTSIERYEREAGIEDGIEKGQACGGS
jgi:hypothetical protein